ncbi:hypothetical protein GCM10009539_23180 [Cryptosporangium japonicum]|uniref:Uncharacterized protein n=1 Tax=Cryptosporangium japonicum TaxID=80872 RepID=A0ABP3DPP9_9ACTN
MESVQIGVGRAVLQLTRDLCLLSLSTAAPHWLDPLAQVYRGVMREAPDDGMSRSDTVPSPPNVRHLAGLSIVSRVTLEDDSPTATAVVA